MAQLVAPSAAPLFPEQGAEAERGETKCPQSPRKVGLSQDQDSAEASCHFPPAFRSTLDGALSNLVKQKVSLQMAGGLDQDEF